MIAALATARGRGGVAVIRVSGAGVFELAEKLTGVKVVPRTVQYVDLKVDRAVMISFKGPASYTGEDIVEFQTHGGEITPKRVLELIFKAGARAAKRGEFTQRAFLNSKLSIEAAEGVLDLIDAKTERAADKALEALGGKRESELKKLYEELISLSSELEHALDISEEELPSDFEGAVEARRLKAIARIDSLVKGEKEGKILREGALVVLAGAPNAGKSSLMNALLGENRAIVSSEAGTTRDSIEEWLDIEGWPIRLTDTAGLRYAKPEQVGLIGEIEQEGIRRSEELIKKADLVIALDCDIEGALKVHSKADLAYGDGINVSSLTGEGLDELKKAIVEKIAERVAQGTMIDGECGNIGESQVEILLRLRGELERAGDEIVLKANAIRSAAMTLGEEIGASYSEDLLDKIFSRFCVGK